MLSAPSGFCVARSPSEPCKAAAPAGVARSCLPPTWQPAAAGCIIAGGLFIAAPLQLATRHIGGRRQRCRGRRSCVQRRSEAGTGAGKFVQLDGPNADADVVPPQFGAFGVIVGGWTDDELEYIVGPTLEELSIARAASAQKQSGEAQEEFMTPVRVLAQSDLDKTLEEILSNLKEMDAVMPDDGDDARLERPLLLFSGWGSEATLEAVRKFRNMVALRRITKEPMAAMAVPRAMKKKMSRLVGEILDDFNLNQGEDQSG
eukprot:TRINITY_DN51690_c0_g1_i1.p1 TRINITY_DN51690_c0_g1~~TRINITY_DN51690_c0_g1_i1.p1  ORF type:complete len:260 (+),score=55.18 TRINITY_DN51690_c0_g1_i1:109-888(+)